MTTTGQLVEPATAAAPPREAVITWQAPPLRLGVGATVEVGYELRRLGVRSSLLVCGPTVARLGLASRVRRLVEAEGVEVTVFDEAPVEPTDEGCLRAAQALDGVRVDSYIGLGGGSAIDTAKVLNLLSTYPGIDLHRYLNEPIGEGLPVPGPLKPLVAVPTTAGSGSECTAMVALGLVEQRLKTGISDGRLRPAAAVVDPLNTLTLPAKVTAASGYDVLTHACEAYTARRFDHLPAYSSPDGRPLYIGGNPISDVWAERALELVGRFLRRAVLNPEDLEARAGMAEAATLAGMGFGNAGTHLPHACAYPIAGRVRDYRAAGYPVDHPLVPHGSAVVVTAAATFAFTYPAAPERHLRAAVLLGADPAGLTAANGAEALPGAVHDLVRDTGGPTGIAAFGYTGSDVPVLVDGALRQRRLLAGCPRQVGRAELTRIVEASMHP